MPILHGLRRLHFERAPPFRLLGAGRASWRRRVMTSSLMSIDRCALRRRRIISRYTIIISRPLSIALRHCFTLYDTTRSTILAIPRRQPSFRRCWLQQFISSPPPALRENIFARRYNGLRVYHQNARHFRSTSFAAPSWRASNALDGHFDYHRLLTPPFATAFVAFLLRQAR